jgi:hypothetical protein
VRKNGRQPEGVLVKYGDLTLGQLEALVNKLGGMSNVRDVLSGRKHVTLMPIRDLQIWNTVSLPDGTERDLVIVSLQQFGLDYLYEPVSRQEIYDKAMERGLRLFPREFVHAIPQLHGDAHKALLGESCMCLVGHEQHALRVNLRIEVRDFHCIAYDNDEFLDARLPCNQKWLFVLPRP